MLRLTGMLTGSALAIAALIVVIGVPQFNDPQQPAVAAPEGEDLISPENVAIQDAPVEELSVEEPASIPRHEPTAEAYPQPAADTASVAAEVIDTLMTSEPILEGPKAAALESKWFAFWSPFRSQIAADGFVSELQRSTGLDYRVVKLKPGVYEVAFEYSDDLDRKDKLSRIAAATGLDLSDG